MKTNRIGTECPILCLHEAQTMAREASEAKKNVSNQVKKETRAQAKAKAKAKAEAILQARIKLLSGKRLEVRGPTRVYYLGTSAVTRSDPFWLEYEHGRQYAPDPQGLLETLVKHVGTAAIEKATVYEK